MEISSMLEQHNGPQIIEPAKLENRLIYSQDIIYLVYPYRYNSSTDTNSASSSK
jgi:hypothetical protein